MHACALRFVFWRWRSDAFLARSIRFLPSANLYRRWPSPIFSPVRHFDAAQCWDPMIRFLFKLKSRRNPTENIHRYTERECRTRFFRLGPPFSTGKNEAPLNTSFDWFKRAFVFAGGLSGRYKGTMLVGLHIGDVWRFVAPQMAQIHNYTFQGAARWQCVITSSNGQFFLQFSEFFGPLVKAIVVLFLLLNCPSTIVASIMLFFNTYFKSTA